MPSARPRSALATIENVKPGTLGVDFKRPDSSRDQVVFDKIYPKGACEKADVQSGDVLLEMNGKPVNTVVDLAMLMREAPMYAGDTIELWRPGAPQIRGATGEANVPQILVERFKLGWRDAKPDGSGGTMAGAGV